jgi:hypothetical protein
MKGKRKIAFVAASSLILITAGLFAQNKAKDKEAVRATALDYIQGWYDADGARMQRALHPDLVKRGLMGDSLRQTSADALVNRTENGMGKNQTGKREKKIVILDMAPTIASVKVVSDQYIDYLHLGKVRGQWVIINVLWIYR